VLPGMVQTRFSMVGIGEEPAQQLPPLSDVAGAGPVGSFPILHQGHIPGGRALGPLAPVGGSVTGLRYLAVVGAYSDTP
jgi:hypothetical protein